MAGGGGTNTTTTTQNSEPWSGAQPYLREVLAGAQNEYRNGSGFYPFPGSTVVPFSNQTMQSLQGIEGLANSGNPLGQAAQNATLGMLNNGGLTPFQQSAGQGFQDFVGGQQPNAISQNLSNYASGANVQGGSPQFLQALDTQSGRLTDDINRSFSNSGRYGSMAHGNEIVDRVGQLRTGAIANEIAREQGQQIQAAGLLGNEQQLGMQNRLAGYSGLGALGAQGAGQLATFTGMSPSVYQQQFAPYGQLANVGSQYEDLATRTLQDQIDRYYRTQQAPWQALGQYNALIGGAGSLGGSTTTQAQQPRNFGLPLGGALAGGQLGSNPMLMGMTGGLSLPIGAGLGGLLGLGGMFF